MQLVLVIRSAGMEPKPTCWIVEDVITMYGILTCEVVDEGYKRFFALENFHCFVILIPRV